MEIFDFIFDGQVIQTVAAIATIVALLFALFQLYQSSRHERALREISGSVSTKVIGAFPDHLPHIAEMINKAQKSVKLMIVFPEQAYFYNPNGYFLYETALNNALRNPNIKVKMIFANGNYRLQSDRRQFKEAKDNWENWKANNSELLNRYIDGHKTTAVELGINGWQELENSEQWHQFQEACEQKAIQKWKDMDGNAEILEVKGFMPISIWVIDDLESIMLISGLDEVIGYAMKTSDTGVTKALMSLQNRYYNNHLDG